LIYEKDLDESIARYQGEVNPSIETCRKLAACLIVKRELFGEPERFPVDADNATGYSYASGPVDTAETIHYDSGTDFSQAIDGRNPDEVWPIMDELMSTVQVLMPRLYDSVMRKLQ
jgi:hypothetical protein